MLRRLLARVLRAGPYLDLYPVIPSLRLAAGGKSYHFGGSFPHRMDPAEHGPGASTTSDRLGRVGAWKRIHIVDAAVFPNIAATTFTLTIMANAHRIASESLELAS
jgi:choline dehydrogenase-like flavoprotein